MALPSLIILTIKEQYQFLAVQLHCRLSYGVYKPLSQHEAQDGLMCVSCWLATHAVPLGLHETNHPLTIRRLFLPPPPMDGEGGFG